MPPTDADADDAPARPPRHPVTLAPRAPWAWRSVAAAGVLTGATAIARTGVPGWEKSLFLRIHDLPRWVDYAVWAPMQAGSAFAPAVAAGAGWAVTRSWRPTVGALVAGWGGWWLAKGVKAVVERGRPAAELGHELVRPTAVTEGLGYVSGHATVAFACAAILSPYVPRPWRIALYALATTVGLARIEVGAHFPLDVVGGAALGLLLAWLWHLAVGVEVAKRA